MHQDEILLFDLFYEEGRVLNLAVEHYPNNEPLIRFNHEEISVERVLLRPQSMDAFVAAMFFFDALTERGENLPALVIPFPFGARQDRLGEGNFLFTAKSMAQMINQRGFPSVTLFDPHSDVISGMIDRCIVVGADEVIETDITASNPAWDMWHAYDAIICPDAGAGKRAQAVAKLLKKPLIHAWKHRDIETGQITGFGVSPVPQDVKRALVVDDACDGGGTFIGLADILPGILLDLYVTHGIFSQGTAMLNERYRNIFTTDSVLRDPLTHSMGMTAYDGIMVLPTCISYLRKGYA